MTLRKCNRIGYLFGLAGNKVPQRVVADLAAGAAMRGVESEVEKVRDSSFPY